MMHIGKTTLPDKTFKTYGEWMKWLNQQDLTPEEEFEANFMRIWNNYKNSIVKARTKKQK
jgi:hypothetical protein